MLPTNEGIGMLKSKKGFTLVELSIVLVIVGLLIGGILVAQSMMTTAQDEMFLKNLQQYEIAADNFKTSYKYYPGDAPGFTPPGNGNGYIDYTLVNGQSSAWCNNGYETIEMWQIFTHLSQAGMLKANYAPLSCAGGSDYTAVVNAPYTQLDQNTINDWGPGVLQCPIQGDGGGSGVFGFAFWVVVQQARYLEAKLGPSVDGTNGCNGTWCTVGLVNNRGTFSSNACVGGQGRHTSCNNSDAAATEYTYFPAPI
jgi:prepilin-type N-terminal cleavage/methylation domain-containing protein